MFIETGDVVLGICLQARPSHLGASHTLVRAAGNIEIIAKFHRMYCVVSENYHHRTAQLEDVWLLETD